MGPLLIIDNERQYYEDMQSHLKEEGVDSIIIFDNYAQAKEYCQQHKPNMAVINIELGETAEEGIEFLQWLQTVDFIILYFVLMKKRDPALAEQIAPFKPLVIFVKPVSIGIFLDSISFLPNRAARLIERRKSQN